MLANLALENAENKMIGAVFNRGLVVISCEAGQPDSAACLYLAERDKRGYDFRDLVPVGSYDDLDTAVTIANIGYGISVKEWATLESLSAANLPLLVQAVKEYGEEKKQRAKMENNQ